MIGEPYTPVEYCKCGKRLTLWFDKDENALWIICSKCGIPQEYCPCKHIVRKEVISK